MSKRDELYASKQQAMKLMELKGFDVVITDILMHKKGGYEIIRDVKKNYPGTKIIAISGGGVIDKKNILQSASKIGADHCISKPFDFANLIEVINQLTGEFNHQAGEGLSGSGLFDLR